MNSEIMQNEDGYYISIDSIMNFPTMIKEFEIKFNLLMSIVTNNRGYVGILDGHMYFPYIMDAQNAIDSIEAVIVMKKLSGG
jgi:hypothetical protein